MLASCSSASKVSSQTAMLERIRFLRPTGTYNQPPRYWSTQPWANFSMTDWDEIREGAHSHQWVCVFLLFSTESLLSARHKKMDYLAFQAVAKSQLTITKARVYFISSFSRLAFLSSFISPKQLLIPFILPSISFPLQHDADSHLSSVTLAYCFWSTRNSALAVLYSGAKAGTAIASLPWAHQNAASSYSSFPFPCSTSPESSSELYPGSSDSTSCPSILREQSSACSLELMDASCAFPLLFILVKKGPWLSGEKSSRACKLVSCIGWTKPNSSLHMQQTRKKIQQL